MVVFRLFSFWKMNLVPVVVISLRRRASILNAANSYLWLLDYRTLQTAVGVFGGEGYTDGMDVLPLMVANAGNSGRAAISSLNCPPVVAVELCREHYVCVVKFTYFYFLHLHVPPIGRKRIILLGANEYKYKIMPRTFLSNIVCINSSSYLMEESQPFHLLVDSFRVGLV